MKRFPVPAVSAFTRWLPRFGALLALCAGVAAFAAPTNAIIRVPAGAATPAGLPELLSKWRQSGQVANVLFLTQGKPEKPEHPAQFEAFVVLEFPNEAAYEAWNRNAAPELPAGLVAHQADALAHGELTPRDSNHSIFVVNAYTPLVSAARFTEFVQGYVAPLYEAMRGTKHVVRYTAYLERGEQGKAQAFNVLEYRDPVAFAAMGTLKPGIREKLAASNPTYPQFDKIKDTLRVDGFGTYATYTELPPPALADLPAYKPDVKIIGALRIVGSELKNAVDQLAEGFRRFHPEARVSTNFMTSSEGGMAGLYCGISDVAPMGDDAKITDQMPFFNTFGYMPTEISVATGGYEKRGSLWAWAIVVNKDNPLEEISMDQLERTFGSERSGGWELVNNNWMYSAKYARSAESNIRTWDQLGLKGDFAGKEIKTFGYIAPGFEIAIQRTWFHWSDKWNSNFMQYVEAKQGSPGPDGVAVASERPLEMLATNQYAIGIAAMMHVKDYPNVKVLKIIPRSGGAAVAFTPDNVANRTYPLIRDAYFYVNKAPGQPLDPKVREFMRFVLSREGQEIIARVGYYYPLKAEYLKEQLKKLD
ncbi:MAG: phosphate transporter periplasmic phosphate-binding protein [Lacunisphaera sp.]|nr:phosphate transporter periplasmic phosphate-binding protein [Lacunisphaera sp.]